MNKLIYAIGIAVASTFITNTKVEKENSTPIQKQNIEKIEQLPSVSEIDSVGLNL